MMKGTERLAAVRVHGGREDDGGEYTSTEPHGVSNLLMHGGCGFPERGEDHKSRKM